MLLFHLDPRLLPGGFTGVDVFFVISGYLIGGQLLDGLARGTFSFAGFYQRRIARIAPASLTTIVFVMIGATFIYNAQDAASAQANSALSALSVINIKLLFQGNYFQLSRDAQPLLHFWSLAVEEQFYLLFPWALWGLTRWTARPTRWIAGAALVSFAVSLAMTKYTPVAAYYLLPPRAWELLVGVILATPAIASGADKRGGHVSLAPAGIFLIMVGMIASSEVNFPGLMALFPVIGTALVIAQRRVGDPLSILLSRPPMRWIGERSFSLYLWHWPIFSLVDYRFLDASGPVRTALKLVLTIAFALASFDYVETPLRRALRRPERRFFVLIGFLVSVGAIGMAGFVLARRYYPDAPSRTILSGGIIANPGGRQTTILMGDSQAVMYARDLLASASLTGSRLEQVAAAGKEELPGLPGSTWPLVQRLLARKHADVLIVAEAWSEKLAKLDDGQLRATLAEVEGPASRVILILEPPIPRADTVDRALLRAGSSRSAAEPVAVAHARSRAVERLRQFAGKRTEIVAVDDLLLDSSRQVRSSANGDLLFHDPGHLSDTGSAMVVPRIVSAWRVALASASEALPRPSNGGNQNPVPAVFPAISGAPSGSQRSDGHEHPHGAHQPQRAW